MSAAVGLALLLLTAHSTVESFVTPATTCRNLIHSRNMDASLVVLHEIPTLLSNLLTQPYSSDVLPIPSTDQQLQMLETGAVASSGGGANAAIPRAAAAAAETLNYAQAATTLFVNMLTPASILAAAMISLGMKKPFELSDEMKADATLKAHIESLRRAYIVVTMISFCSELLAVMWGTVAVNQLTEKTVLPTSSVWELLQRDVDLEWAAVNSHFVVGLIGFMYMVGIRGYVMLIAAGASDALIVSTLSGVGAALLLMVSIVNRGVEAGGGDGVGYGSNILDLFGHYISLLYERAKGMEVLGDLSPTMTPSVGPMGMAAIILELTSVGFALYAILSPLFENSSINHSNGIESLDTSQSAEAVNGATAANFTSSDPIIMNGEIYETTDQNEIDIPPSIP